MTLSLRDVTFRYQEHGKRNILDHVNLELEEGGLTVLMGASGCGKSTLAAVMAGLYPENGGYMESGDISLFGHRLADLNQQQRAGLLTILFQNPDLQFCMDTLRKEMRFCMENICVPAEEMDDRLLRAAKRMDAEVLLDRPLSTLSGGEKQRAALCCLDVMESRCVLLDESFANLDQSAARALVEKLLDMKRSGRTILAIDHRVDLWLDAADEIILLEEGGRVAARGITKANLAAYRETFHRLGLFYPGETRRSVPVRQGKETLLELKNVTIYSGEEKTRWFQKSVQTGECLLQNANVRFQKGCMTAVLGPSGSGKTTTFLSVLKQHPYTGQILLGGTDIAGLRKNELYRQIGIVFQNPENQFITQNVEEEVCQSIRIWDKTSSEEARKERAKAMLEAYNLYRFRRYSPYMLSQGQQRRLAVLSVLAGGQRLLLLDEPTYGQDACSTEAIMRQMRERVERDGLTVILITHDEALADAWADNRVWLADRQLREENE